MGEFSRALRDAESELLEVADVDAARVRVAARLRAGEGRSERPRARGPALALAWLAPAVLCAVSLGVGYWLGTRADVEPAIALAPVPGSETTRRGAAPGGGLRDIAAPLAEVASIGQLLAEQENGACEFSVNSKSYGKLEILDMPLPAGEHDVYCRRGPRAQHQRLTIKAGKTTRVVFQFPENMVEEIDQEEAPANTDAAMRGTLVAIAIGGSCSFSVDGTPRGNKSSLRLKVDVGPHTVDCVEGDGRAHSQTVVVANDKPGIASFRIEFTGAASRPPTNVPKPKRSGKPGVIDPWQRQ